MKARTGDDVESGALKLGTHAFSDSGGGGSNRIGGYSRALSAIGGGFAAAVAGRQPGSNDGPGRTAGIIYRSRGRLPIDPR